MRKGTAYLIILFGLMASYCSLNMTFTSSDNNARSETITYKDFKVSFGAGGKAGQRKAILLHVIPERQVKVFADSMQVYFREKRIGYDILDEGQPTDLKEFSIFRGEKTIVYLLEVNGTFASSDSLLFFAEDIFQVGDRVHDLDTLVFKMPR